MTIDQWKDINSFARMAAVIILGISVYLWLSKRVISYTTAKLLIVIPSLLTGIPAGFGYGWMFSLFVTILQTSVLYFIVEMANKESQQKLQVEKTHAENKKRIL